MRSFMQRLAALAAGLISLGALSQDVAWRTGFTGLHAGNARPGCIDSFYLPFGTRHSAVMPNGDYVVTGCAGNGNDDDILTVRYDGTTGAVVWASAVGGSGREKDGGSTVAVDAAGDVLVAGYTIERGSSSPTTRLVKLRGVDGVQLWSVLTGPTSDTASRTVAVGPGNEIYSLDSDFARLARHDPATGAVIWIRVLGDGTSSRWTYAQDLLVDAAGEVLVFGDGEVPQSVGGRVAKLSRANGATLWDVGGIPMSPGAQAGALDPGGNIVIAGSWREDTSAPPSLQVFKLSSVNGGSLWARSYPFAGTNSFSEVPALKTDPNGDIVILGYRRAFGSDDGASLVFKLSGSDGAPLWTAVEDSGPGNDMGANLAIDASGNAYVAGSYFNASASTTLLRTVRFNGADGVRLWAADVEAPGSFASGAAIGANGDVLVSGTSQLRFRVLRYAAATGTQVWSAANPPIRGVERLEGRQLSAARNGRIAMLAFSPTTAGRGGRLTLHDVADGHVVWERRIDGLASTKDVYGLTPGSGSPLVALDTAGDVVVAGRRGLSMFAAKYAAASGAELWSTVYEEAGVVPQGWARALALDASDNVILGGESYSCNAVTLLCGTNMRTVKLSGANGAPLWASTQGNQPPLYRAVSALALGPGSVVVVGYDEAMQAARTIKYDAATGVEQWSAAFRDAKATGIVVDGAGDVYVALGRLDGALGTVQVLKYSGATGAALWTYTLQGARAEAMVLDPTGQVVVAYSQGDALNQPLYWRIVKLDPANGMSRWNRVLTEYTGISRSMVKALAVDAEGNVVAGGSTDLLALEEARVAKWDGLTGEKLWELTLSGASELGTVAALAFDAGGAVYAAGMAASVLAPEATFLAKITGGRTTPQVRAQPDFDGRGKADILWRHADGRYAIWLMNGLAVERSVVFLGPSGTGWIGPMTFDTNGDYRSDIVFANPDGRHSIQLTNGDPFGSYNLGASLVQPGWTLVTSGDFDGDNRGDMLLRHADGRHKVLFMTGLDRYGEFVVPALPGWRIARAADFDGDGRDDFLWVHDDGRIAIWLMDGGAVRASAEILGGGSGWSVSHLADLDGDGKADILWQHSDGTVAAWLMNGIAIKSGRSLLGAGTGWSVSHVADMDGDFERDIVWRHTDGRVAIWLMHGLAPHTMTQILNAGSGWSVAAMRDLDGDGKADIVWQHADGRVAAWIMNGTAMTGGLEIMPAGTGWTVLGGN